MLIVMALLTQSTVFGIDNYRSEKTKMYNKEELEVATFGSGCFWCTEAVFERLQGVDKVISGFSGGKVKNPSYKEITTGRIPGMQRYARSGSIHPGSLFRNFWMYSGICMTRRH